MPPTPTTPGAPNLPPGGRMAVLLFAWVVLVVSCSVSSRVATQTSGHWIASLEKPEIEEPAEASGDPSTQPQGSGQAQAGTEPPPKVSDTNGPSTDSTPTAVPKVETSSVAVAPTNPPTPPIPVPNPPFVPPKPVDCVLVMDMLYSMNRFVTDTPRIVSEVLNEQRIPKHIFGSSALGLWGYRGTNDAGPIGFTTRNFSPTLVTPPDFLGLLRDHLEPTELAGPWEDGGFLGVYDALTQTAWREGSVRTLILIGDSSSYEGDDPRNSQHLSEELLRSKANREQVRILVVFIVRSEKLIQLDHPAARRQFGRLADNHALKFGIDLLEVTSDKEAGITFAETYTRAVHRAIEAALYQQPL